MPKGGGRGSSSKKPPPLTAPTEDGSNVVFATVGKGKKRETQQDKNNDGAKKPSASGEDAVKKPETRALIGGASWTGKLPVNLLSEHCQKQKWGKPDYSMHRDSEGFSSMVALKGTNPKTKEPMTLPAFKLPPTHKHLALKPTAVEARHFAATYALFRVCSMRNIHMMLPPAYKALWKSDFENLKKEDVKENRGWMYEADPFVAAVERDEIKAAMAKKREEKEKQQANEARQPQISLEFGGSDAVRSGKPISSKGWARAPKIELGKRIRAQIEDLVRRQTIWNPQGSEIVAIEKALIVQELTQLGFRASHVQEAVNECKDRKETLEWLLIHVPEDDLPSWSLPEGYTAGLSLASGNLKREAAIKRLAAAGYPSELCERYLHDCNEDENAAAEALQKTLILDAKGKKPDVSTLNSDEIEIEREAWTEEGNTLEAIFSDSFSRKLSPESYQIRLQVTDNGKIITLEVRPSKNYPKTVPTVFILAPTLPSFIRLTIARQVIEHAQINLVGEPMVFQLIDWLEAEIPRIIENPGKLRDLATVISGELVPSKPIKNDGKLPKRRRAFDQGSDHAVSSMMLEKWSNVQKTPQQSKMMSQRQRLPAWSLRDEIVSTVNSHQVIIISGETGSGKSTQSVQFVLDDMIQRQTGARASIICTQPRRISALSLADRVSEERCSSVGDEIGYSIRGETRSKPGVTRVTFVTIGVLLRRLQTSGGKRDDVVAALADTSHVFVDEVHERSLDIDFLLVLLRDILPLRKDFKVILMSATLDSNTFDQYFSSVSSVGNINIPGRTFPVDDYYLDDVIRETGFKISGIENDSEIENVSHEHSKVAGAIKRVGMGINYELIATTVKMIDSQLGDQEGAILLFLPGTMEINRTIDSLRSLSKIYALPLHASLTPSEQRRVFPKAPSRKRKVIAATNVAETSITIEDIVAVIDCGRVKETSFDPSNNIVKLEEVWASRAACKQRRGRAGRVQAGICYKLYTRYAESKMAERPDPEIKRVPLEQLCLSVRAMGIENIPDFLSSALTPPDITAVAGAIDLLHRIGALDSGDLTALGIHMSMIPADLRCSKLMIYGAIFGCLEACLTIAAILSVRSPFVTPQTKREESKKARKSFAPGQGDLICDLRAYEDWDQRRPTLTYREARIWCDENFLSSQTLSDVSSNRLQLLSSMIDAGFVPPSYRFETDSQLNSNIHNDALVRALIAGSFCPQIAQIDFPDKKFAASHTGAVEIDPEARTIKYFNEENGRVFVHPSSTLFDAQSYQGGVAYMSYFNKMATSKVFIRELTPFNAFGGLLFGGPLTLDTMGRGIVLDGWLRIRGWARIGVLASRLRRILDDLLLRKIKEPSFEIGNSEVVKVVRHLVEFNGQDR